MSTENETENSLESFDTLDKRVAVLEVRQEYTFEKLESAEKNIIRIMEKVDEHMSATASSNMTLQTNLSAVTNAVTTLSLNMKDINQTLKSLAVSAAESKIKFVKWETIVRTFTKFISVMAIVISAVWTVYTFTIDHKAEITQTSQKILK